MSNTPSTIVIKLVDNEEMQRRWPQIEAALRLSFADSHYVDEGYSIANTIAYTLAGVHGHLGPFMGHALALDDQDQVVGGLFCIRTTNPGGEQDTEVGWVFLVPDLPIRERAHVLDAIMELTFETLRKQGFKRIVTNMGTPAGARVMSRRYGFTHEPIPGKTNRWVGAL